MINKTDIFMGLLTIIIIIGSINIISGENEIISGDTIYINNEDIFISACPHTLYESGNVTFIVETKSYTGDIDLIWGFNKATAKIKSIKSDTKEIKSIAKPENKIVNGNHLLYKDKNQKIKHNEQVEFIVYIDVNNFSSGKYDFMVKPSSMTIEEAKINNQLYILDPWWDSTFKHYKKIHINNVANGALNDYQCNINISYIEGMQTDFDDIRFIDDTTLGYAYSLPYWIENKSNGIWCNVWFKTMALDMYQWNNDTFKLYYNNSGVSSESSISDTFIQGSGSSGAGFHLAKIVTPPFIFESEVYLHPGAGTNSIGLTEQSFASLDAVYMDLHENTYILYAKTRKNGITSSSLIAGASLITAKYKIGSSSTTTQFFRNDNLYAQISTNQASDPMGISYSPSGGTDHINWAFVREFSVFDPICYIKETFSETLKYNLTNNINNIVYSDARIQVEGSGLFSNWTMASVTNTANVTITDYDNATGDFILYDGNIDYIEVIGLINASIAVLTHDNLQVESGLVVNNFYRFDTDIGAGNYSINVIQYTNNETGVHGFIYEGVAGSNIYLDKVVVYIFNSTWSDTTVSANGGYYSFVGLSNKTYTLNFKKDRYKEVLYQYVTPANLSMYRKDIYMQKSTGDYYSRHYCTFIVKNLFGGRYEGVNTLVYENGVVIDNENTGFDGSVVFHLFEDVEYRITFIDSTQNINEEIILMPRDDRYIIWVDAYSFSPENDTRIDNVNYWWVKNEINNTYSWLNFTYSDADKKTTLLKYWINDSNNTNLYYVAYINPCELGDCKIPAMVNNSNHTYVVHFSANHPDYPNLQNSVVQTFVFYNKKLIDLLFAEQWQYTIVSLFILILIGTVFSGSNAAQGSLIIVLAAWLFSFIQWLPSSTMGYGALVLASILSVTWNLRKSDIVHT